MRALVLLASSCPLQRRDGLLYDSRAGMPCSLRGTIGFFGRWGHAASRGNFSLVLVPSPRGTPVRSAASASQAPSTGAVVRVCASTGCTLAVVLRWHCRPAHTPWPDQPGDRQPSIASTRDRPYRRSACETAP